MLSQIKNNKNEENAIRFEDAPFTHAIHQYFDFELSTLKK